MRHRVETKAREPEPEAPQPQDETGCCHYWLIDSPDGPTSRGVCRFCGAEKYFHNTPPEFLLSQRDDRESESTDNKPGNT